jgi:hypothetical protein
MRRMLKLVVLPFAVVLLVAGGLCWLLTPRPRCLPLCPAQRQVVELSEDGALSLLRQGEDNADSEFILCETATGNELVRLTSHNGPAGVGRPHRDVAGRRRW